jgi:hypothetical protein
MRLFRPSSASCPSGPRPRYFGPRLASPTPLARQPPPPHGVARSAASPSSRSARAANAAIAFAVSATSVKARVGRDTFDSWQIIAYYPAPRNALMGLTRCRRTARVDKMGTAAIAARRYRAISMT